MKNPDDTDGHRAFALPGARLQYGPDKLVEVEHIALRLEPDLETRTLEGLCTTTVRAFDEPVERLVLNAIDLEIASVQRDGHPLRFDRRDGTLVIRFDPVIAAGERAS
ncbi:MAG TPA: hypothetical protein VGN11_10700, partial [Candidatus Baltobacteraceae bacterium]|nr:hypothetical protein [Candidatus Baltobacteraceae bacterium]